MGLNVVIACHRHQEQTYMMRGEETRDLQVWMRRHGKCFEARQVDIYRDSDDYPDYEEAWEYEKRPAVAGTVDLLQLAGTVLSEK